jgi:hypothetical protein
MTFREKSFQSLILDVWWGIINFEILNFYTSSVLKKNLLPNVFTVEILQPKLQGEVANVLNITTSTLDKENHL